LPGNENQFLCILHQIQTDSQPNAPSFPEKKSAKDEPLASVELFEFDTFKHKALLYIDLSAKGKKSALNC
jgi:hypothetical protein